MSATDLAVVVEGWATFAGLIVVALGAAFAGVQLRRQAKARHLESVMAVLSDVRPLEVAKAWEVFRSLPDGFDLWALQEDEHDAAMIVLASYSRLGNLLAAGFVEERDIFPHITFSIGAIDTWEKVKHLSRTDPRAGVLAPGMFIEFLASRAQDYLARKGVGQFGGIPVFDADRSVLDAFGKRVRATAS